MAKTANKTINPNRVYTTQTAADIVGTSDQTLIRKIEDGELKAKRLGKGWKILGSSLLTYISTPTITQQKPNIES